VKRTVAAAVVIGAMLMLAGCSGGQSDTDKAMSKCVQINERTPQVGTHDGAVSTCKAVEQRIGVAKFTKTFKDVNVDIAVQQLGGK
jgi:hypothetical protein